MPLVEVPIEAAMLTASLVSITSATCVSKFSFADKPPGYWEENGFVLHSAIPYAIILAIVVLS